MAEQNSEKMKALQAAMQKIEKSYGHGSIMRMADENIEQVDVIPTGSIGLNAALGVGGYPKGRIIEIYGPESSGKTTLAIHAIAEAQKRGGIAAFIDAEHAFDRFYAQKLGVDMNNLWISQPDNGEQALEIADQLIRSSAVDIIVVDSVAALTPKAEIEGDMGENKVGLHARLMSQALRKLTSNISKTNTTCIFINQLREKIGVMFGNPETTTGGNALKFYASVRLDIRRVTSIKDGDEVKGNQVRVKVVKNRVAPPFRKAEFDIMFGTGISKSGEIVDIGVQLGIVKKSGSWFSYGDQKLAQGRDATKKLMEDNPELAEEIEQKGMSLDDIVSYIADAVCQRAADGNNYGTVIIPEGVIEFIPAIKKLIAQLNDVLAMPEAKEISRDEQVDFAKSHLTEENLAVFNSLPVGVARQLALDRDPHGNVQVSLIETEKLLSTMVAQKLEKMKKKGTFTGKFATQHHFFGYEGRCAAPSNFDADYCYALGASAAQLIAAGKTGYMAIVKNTTAPASEWKAGGVPITMMMNMEKRNGEMKPVIRKALVELDGAPFKEFAAHRDEWARKTAYVYPGPIQYWGPTEVCDQPTKTLALEQAK